MNEFTLIERYFNFSPPDVDTPVSIGDDAAVVACPGSLAITVDTLVAGVHFPQDAAPADIGFKALAVNLSDLAAMGATPRWFTLALTLPASDHDWLSDFASGLRALAERMDIRLIGGDTTRGPLAISIQAIGIAPPGGAILRSGANPGDDIHVTGTLGDAALGLRIQRGELSLDDAMNERCLGRLNRPEPRVLAGSRLAPLASAMIDCSDGFAADLGHLLAASRVGAEVDFQALPFSSAVRRWLDEGGEAALPLSGGDDYELIFTAPAASRKKIASIARMLGLPMTRVGRIVEGRGLRFQSADGAPIVLERPGYDHFATATESPS